MTRTNTLKNEFTFLSEFKDVSVDFSLQSRKAAVSIKNRVDQKITLIIVFPDLYPMGQLPTFMFDQSTSLDKQLQVCATPPPPQSVTY